MNLIENIECVPTGITLIKNEEKPENDTGKISGIYKIINKINGKYYVGSAINICNGKYSRWNEHIRRLRNNRHHNIHLQRAWDKYGKNNFIFTIIEKTVPEKLIEKEQYYLDIAKMEQNKCYNLSFISDRIDMTDDIKRKISEKHKIRLKDKTKCSMYGKHHSEKTKQLMRELKLGSKSPNYGRHWSDETKMKMSINSAKTNLGKHLSEETKNKIRIARLEYLKNKNLIIHS